MEFLGRRTRERLGCGPSGSRVWRCAALLLILASRLEAVAEDVSSRETAIKAVFLFNFAQFVDWPPSAFPSPDSPFVIGVLGDDPFGAFLDATVKGEKVKGHPLLVRRFHQVDEATGCHILFISASESDRFEHDFSALKDRAILTVGDAEGFAQRGGIIRFRE